LNQKAEVPVMPRFFFHLHALLNKQDILFSNERNLNILETRHFGRIAFVEVGAYPLVESFRFIRSMNLSSAVRKRRSFALLVQPLLYLANRGAL
jgi:hypothetical protein